jgi:hypothetical protein
MWRCLEHKFRDSLGGDSGVVGSSAVTFNLFLEIQYASCLFVWP